MPLPPEYRLYIDEVGNADLGASQDPNHRYLSLTGIIFSISDIRSHVKKDLEDLKREIFRPDPDEPFILHRKELSRQKYPFNVLQDPIVKHRFDEGIISLITKWDYTVITVTIDKLMHLNKYATWQVNPYHYCLRIMLERYVKWLATAQSCGDVMAEARGGKEDRMLNSSFEKLICIGTNYMHPQAFQRRITSKKLKLKPKKDNVSGLQIADLLAHPSYRAMKMMVEGNPLPDDFGTKIYNILNSSKYHRSHSGVIEGYGRKWLP